MGGQDLLGMPSDLMREAKRPFDDASLSDRTLAVPTRLLYTISTESPCGTLKVIVSEAKQVSKWPIERHLQGRQSGSEPSVPVEGVRCLLTSSA